MTRFVGLGLLTVSALALNASAAFADYELNILHINDLHSRIESINKFDSTCSPEEEAKKECFGGVARLKTEIDQRRKALEGRNVLLLNAGDNFQGSLFYTTYKGAAEVEFLNDMKFDAMTVGNHEFDDGEMALAPFLDKAQFPVVTANVQTDSESKLGDRIKRSVVLEVGGQKIGIVGAVTNDTPELSSPGPHVKITDDVSAINAEVDALKAQGINKIIALTHVGYPRDIETIAKIPGVDVVVGGHSHTLLSNTDPKAAGPYPTMVDNPGGYKVPVVTAASYSKYLGDIVVTFDDDGVVKEAKGDPILLDASVEPDPAMTARIAELAKPIAELRAKVIGNTEAPIEGAREVCRGQECSMGNLVADAMLDRTKGQGIAIAIQNGGGLRASIDAGDVTVGEVLTVLPFQNTVATFQLTGADVIAALENGLSQIEEGAGRFPQVAGIRYTYDKSKPAGSRVVSVEVKDGDNFVPLDPNKTYGVVSNNYMRAGGDGYSVFAKNGKNAYDYGPDLENVVADYLAAHNPYKPYIDGRVTAVAATGTAAEGAQAKPVDKQIVPAAEAPATATPPAATAPATAPATSPAAPQAAQPATPPAAEPAPAAPAAKAEAPPASQTPTTHVVAAGDTLWDLAKHFYGNASLWRKLAAANHHVNPHRLTVGRELQIPAP